MSSAVCDQSIRLQTEISLLQVSTNHKRCLHRSVRASSKIYHVKHRNHQPSLPFEVHAGSNFHELSCELN